METLLRWVIAASLVVLIITASLDNFRLILPALITFVLAAIAYLRLPEVQR